jgi:hypothetical protein
VERQCIVHGGEEGVDGLVGLDAVCITLEKGWTSMASNHICSATMMYWLPLPDRGWKHPMSSVKILFLRRSNSWIELASAVVVTVVTCGVDWGCWVDQICWRMKKSINKR